MQKKEHTFADPKEKRIYIPKEFWVGFIVYPILCVAYPLITNNEWLQTLTIEMVLLIVSTPIIGGLSVTIGVYALKQIWSEL